MPLRTFCPLSRLDAFADFVMGKGCPNRHGKGSYQALQVYVSGKWEILYSNPTEFPSVCFTVGVSPLSLLLEGFLKNEH
jgi:alkyl hydroperoxide reductase subunit AhpC